MKTPVASVISRTSPCTDLLIASAVLQPKPMKEKYFSADVDKLAVDPIWDQEQRTRAQKQEQGDRGEARDGQVIRCVCPPLGGLPSSVDIFVG